MLRKKLHITRPSSDMYSNSYNLQLCRCEKFETHRILLSKYKRGTAESFLSNFVIGFLDVRGSECNSHIQWKVVHVSSTTWIKAMLKYPGRLVSSDTLLATKFISVAKPLIPPWNPLHLKRNQFTRIVIHPVSIKPSPPNWALEISLQCMRLFSMGRFLHRVGNSTRQWLYIHSMCCHDDLSGYHF